MSWIPMEKWVEPDSRTPFALASDLHGITWTSYREGNRWHDDFWPNLDGKEVKATHFQRIEPAPERDVINITYRMRGEQVEIGIHNARRVLEFWTIPIAWYEAIRESEMPRIDEMDDRNMYTCPRCNGEKVIEILGGPDLRPCPRCASFEEETQ